MSVWVWIVQYKFKATGMQTKNRNFNAFLLIQFHSVFYCVKNSKQNLYNHYHFYFTIKGHSTDEYSCDGFSFFFFSHLLCFYSLEKLFRIRRSQQEQEQQQSKDTGMLAEMFVAGLVTTTIGYRVIYKDMHALSPLPLQQVIFLRLSSPSYDKLWITPALERAHTNNKETETKMNYNEKLN